jgi:PAS domain S-box-containing protein
MPPHSETASAFGARLKYLRHLKSMTQKELAAKADLSVKHLARIEQGASVPSFQVMERLALALETTCFNFFLHDVLANNPGLTQSPPNHREACMPPDLRLCLAVRLGVWITRGGREKPVWSDSLYTMLGYAPGSVKPGIKRFLKHVAPPQQEETLRFLWNQGEAGNGEDLLIAVTGSHRQQRTFQLSRKMVTGLVEAPDQTLVIIQDVTECQALNQALITNQAELKAYVQDKNQALAETVERLKLEAAQREKAETEWRIHERMINFSKDAQAYVDAGGMIRAVNRQYAIRLGREPGRIVGRDYLEFMAEAWGEEFTQRQVAPLMRQALRRNVPRPLFIWLDYPALGRRYVRATFSPCVVNKEVVGLVVTVHDLTELEQARQDLEIYKHAVNSSLKPMAIADLNNVLTRVNPAFLEMWGYASAAECVGRHATEFHDPAEPVHEVIAALRATGTWRGRLVCKRKNGCRFLAEVFTSEMKDCHGRLVGYTANFLRLPDVPDGETDFFVLET